MIPVVCMRNGKSPDQISLPQGEHNLSALFTALQTLLPADGPAQPQQCRIRNKDTGGYADEPIDMFLVFLQMPVKLGMKGERKKR